MNFKDATVCEVSLMLLTKEGTADLKKETMLLRSDSRASLETILSFEMYVSGICNFMMKKKVKNLSTLGHSMNFTIQCPTLRKKT